MLIKKKQILKNKLIFSSKEGGMSLKKNAIVESLFFIEAGTGAGEKKYPDRLRNTEHYQSILDFLTSRLNLESLLLIAEKLST